MQGVHGAMAGLTQHGSLAETRCPHVAGKVILFHQADVADVMDFTRNVGCTATLAFMGVETFHQFRTAENKLREWSDINSAPRSRCLSQILQSP
jgi:hypothetical protein